MKYGAFFKWMVFTSLIMVVSSCFKDDLASDEKQKLKEQEDLKAYLEYNNITTVPTESGLYYLETKTGTGIFPDSGDVASILFTTRLLASGYLLESRLVIPLPVTLGNGEVIPGLDEGIRLMKKNGTATLIIPSQLAYGSYGYGSVIGPYRTLIMDVKLIDLATD